MNAGGAEDRARGTVHGGSPLRVGDLIDVRPLELVAGGEALARVDGFPLFVPAIYPGDLARVRVTEIKKGYGRAIAEELLELSSQRRLEPCPVAGLCGGCDWTALRLDQQLSAKHAILVSSLRRIGKFDERDIPPLRIHPSPLNYRLRSRLQIDPVSREIGFFSLRSHQVVSLPAECEVVGPALLRHTEDLRHLARTNLSASAIETFETDHRFLAQSTEEGEAEPVTVDVDGREYQLSTRSFFQVNRHQLGRLITLVTGLAAGLASKNVAFDLYAGVGFFTLPISRLFETVYSVESSKASRPWAKVNAAGSPAIRLFEESVEQFFKRGLRNVDFILVDPPRAGLTAAAIEGIDGTLARKVCYLSCDPVTFSRDAARLARRGWTLRSLDLVDLFPNTHHIETLSSFERAS